MSIVDNLSLHWYLVLEYQFRWHHVQEMCTLRINQHHLLNRIDEDLQRLDPTIVVGPPTNQIVYRHECAVALYDSCAARYLLHEIEKELTLQMRRLFVVLNLSASADLVGYDNV